MPRLTGFGRFGLTRVSRSCCRMRRLCSEQGFAEIIRYREIAHISCETVNNVKMQSFCAQECAPPQVGVSNRVGFTAQSFDIDYSMRTGALHPRNNMASTPTCSFRCLDARDDIPRPCNKWEKYLLRARQHRWVHGRLPIFSSTPIGTMIPSNMFHAPSYFPLVVQLNGAVNEAELYRYVVRSIGVFEQAVYTEAHAQSAKARDHLGNAKPIGEGSGRPHPYHNSPLTGEVSDAMVSIWGNDNLIEFEHLEEAVSR